MKILLPFLFVYIEFSKKKTKRIGFLLVRVILNFNLIQDVPLIPLGHVFFLRQGQPGTKPC